jgi:hypothetical protein
MPGTYQIVYRVPGTMTMSETDSTADAFRLIDSIGYDPNATLISVDFVVSPPTGNELSVRDWLRKAVADEEADRV